jgi:hypothetical protein
LLTVIAPSALDFQLETGEILTKEPLLTNPAAQRIAVKAPVRSLNGVVADLGRTGLTIERLYDY